MLVVQFISVLLLISCVAHIYFTLNSPKVGLLVLVVSLVIFSTSILPEMKEKHYLVSIKKSSFETVYVNTRTGCLYLEQNVQMVDNDGNCIKVGIVK